MKFLYFKRAVGFTIGCLWFLIIPPMCIQSEQAQWAARNGQPKWENLDRYVEFVASPISLFVDVLLAGSRTSFLADTFISIGQVLFGFLTLLFLMFGWAAFVLCAEDTESEAN